MSSFWQNKKVLVTGAGGFIGSHLTESLSNAGANVTAMIHYDSRSNMSNLEYLSKETLKKMTIISGDVCDPFFVNSAVEGQDTVFHLAALIAIPYSYVAPHSYVQTNINGTLNVAEACRKHKVRRMIHTSTSETYGTAIYAPIDEKHPIQGQSPYSASKIGADKMIESYYNSFDLPVVTLRPFNTYGPRQSARAVLPTIISQCLSSESKQITLGDLTPIRDMNFVLDTAGAFMAVAENDKCIGKTLNTGTGMGITVGEMAQMIIKLTGASKELVQDSSRIRPAKSEVFKLISNSNQLRELTGWIPKTSFEKGIDECINFIKNNLHQYKIGTYER
jgi:NAD dependent epimerase/dehydratase